MDQSHNPVVRTINILRDKSLVDPRGQAFLTCGRYDKDVSAAARPPIKLSRFVFATRRSFLALFARRSYKKVINAQGYVAVIARRLSDVRSLRAPRSRSAP